MGTGGFIQKVPVALLQKSLLIENLISPPGDERDHVTSVVKIINGVD